jgi:hypothetical protein
LKLKVCPSSTIAPEPGLVGVYVTDACGPLSKTSESKPPTPPSKVPARVPPRSTVSVSLLLAAPVRLPTFWNDALTPLPLTLPASWPVSDQVVLPGAAVEGDRGRRIAAERLGVDRELVVAVAADDGNRRDIADIAEREHGIVGLVDHLHPLDRHGLGVDLLRLLHHFHNDAVIGGLGAGVMRQIDGEHVGAEQKPRLQRIEDQAVVCRAGGRALPQDGPEPAPAAPRPGLTGIRTARRPLQADRLKRKRHPLTSWVALWFL